MTIHYLRTTDDASQARDAIAKDINEMPSELLIRELAQHAMDHNRRQSELHPEQAETCPYSGVKFVNTGARVIVTTVKMNRSTKLVVMNTAPGMDAEVFKKFATELRWSSRTEKAGNGQRNFGWGVRTVCLKASPEGVDTYSIHKGVIRHVKMWRDPSTGWASTTPVEIVKALPNGLTLPSKEGTVTILHGEEGRPNTMTNPWKGGSITSIRKAITSRYMTTCGVRVDMTEELQSSNNGGNLYAVGSWLEGQEAKVIAKAKKKLLQEPVIHHESGGVTVLIFKAHKMDGGKETSDMPIGAAWMQPFGGISHDGELYGLRSGRMYGNQASAFGLGTVSDVVSVIVIDNDETRLRVRKDRTALQYVDGITDSKGERVAKADADAKLTHYREAIREAKDSPQAEWLRRLIKDRMSQAVVNQNREARKRMHELAQALDLVTNVNGAKLDENGQPIVDENGFTGIKLPQTDRPVMPSDHPKPGDHNPQQGKRGGNKAGTPTSGGTFQPFMVQPADGSVPAEQPFMWLNTGKGDMPLLTFNKRFTLFNNMMELLMKEAKNIDEEKLEMYFNGAMQSVLQDVLGPTYVMWRWREANGDLRSIAESEAHWNGPANYEVGDISRILTEVVAIVRAKVADQTKLRAV